MKPIYAIAKLTVKSAFRFKIVALLAVFLVLAVSALPLLLKDDGTARGFVQILLTYSLGLTVTTLALSTLWLSCSLLAKDIEDCRIQMLVVKPVSRWKIWLGKWLGVMTINALRIPALPEARQPRTRAPLKRNPESAPAGCLYCSDA